VRGQRLLRFLEEEVAEVVVDGVSGLVVHLSFGGIFDVSHDTDLLGLGVEHDACDGVVMSFSSHHELFGGSIFVDLLVNGQDLEKVSHSGILLVKVARDHIIVCMQDNIIFAHDVEQLFREVREEIAFGLGVDLPVQRTALVVHHHVAKGFGVVVIHHKVNLLKTLADGKHRECNTKIVFLLLRVLKYLSHGLVVALRVALFVKLRDAASGHEDSVDLVEYGIEVFVFEVVEDRHGEVSCVVDEVDVVFPSVLRVRERVVVELFCGGHCWDSDHRSADLEIGPIEVRVIFFEELHVFLEVVDAIGTVIWVVDRGHVGLQSPGHFCQYSRGK